MSQGALDSNLSDRHMEGRGPLESGSQLRISHDETPPPPAEELFSASERTWPSRPPPPNTEEWGNAVLTEDEQRLFVKSRGRDVVLILIGVVLGAIFLALMQFALQAR